MRAVVFDTWAWFEVFHGTPRGIRIVEEYVADPHTRILTADIVLAEASAMLHAKGRGADAASLLDDIIGTSDEVVPIGKDDALRAGALRVELRKRDAGASFADAVLLSIARNREATLVSCDAAFEGQPDVVCVGGK